MIRFPLPNRSRLAILLPVALLATACTSREQTGKGFVFPGGDTKRGQTAFLELGCTQCHTVSGLTLPVPDPAPQQVIVLGGEVSSLRSYGDLITSIIHPSQRASEKFTTAPPAERPATPMPTVNEVMTVQQMLDLAAFLQPHYERLLPLHEVQMF